MSSGARGLKAAFSCCFVESTNAMRHAQPFVPLPIAEAQVSKDVTWQTFEGKGAQ